MRNVIVGTAGHVDHGKTCLIKALTGTDTDRLKEEKKRGITIELGFANMPNDRELNIGIIDVPGHEKFVKNMLAGIGGIDLVLLVVAADEGIMPQTIEHFEIIKMLGISRGIVVITKVDAVDEEWLEMVREDIRSHVEGTFLESSPMIEVSSHTGENIEKLKDLICDLVSLGSERREDPSLLRIPIDRVFTVDGFGTVITGTLIEGAISVGDEVDIYPVCKRAKVRNVQVHGNVVETAYAGQRTAVNLTGIKKEDIERGFVIAAKGSLTPTMILDVRLDMFDDSKRSLINGSRLHLYYGASEVLCKAVLLDKDTLESGESGYAQLRLEENAALKKGDRFIVRFYSPLETIGGGVVLDSNPPKRKRLNEEVISSLSIKDKGTVEEVFEQILLEESKALAPVSDLSARMAITLGEAEAILNKLLQIGSATDLGRNLVVHKEYFNYASDKAIDILDQYHKQNPISVGMFKEEFRTRLGEKLFIKDAKSLELIIKKLVEEKLIKEAGNYTSRYDFEISYSDEQLKMKNRIADKYMALGYEIPDIEEVAASEKDRALAKQIIEALATEGVLERISYQYFIHSTHWMKALEGLREHMNKKSSITLGEFRDYLGTSRKYSVIILEAFDERKITRMEKDARVLIK
ncbi:selenocysteine-specific translation elongation factor [Alloiococcus sp. CFN-8]|uniref:selenocysteine-specific translation elongation factor n=1 Tax=Alloiococcus sp. CFN-8 TaxID=3416081 RepID=UPI003CF89520